MSSATSQLVALPPNALRARRDDVGAQARWNMSRLAEAAAVSVENQPEMIVLKL